MGLITRFLPDSMVHRLYTKSAFKYADSLAVLVGSNPLLIEKLEQQFKFWEGEYTRRGHHPVDLRLLYYGAEDGSSIEYLLGEKVRQSAEKSSSSRKS
ncbi:MAG TPA: hypothetical protein VJC39_00775 [Candidatus Nanoarchaeia archaeon]|nr:hypothetical protein [Candidatus Nanoarchaeia archaeon]